MKRSLKLTELCKLIDNEEWDAAVCLANNLYFKYGKSCAFDTLPQDEAKALACLHPDPDIREALGCEAPKHAPASAARRHKNL